jgi:DedD protein
MATTTSEEELQLKKRARRRLIGAIALVTVVAVFLPMVLDHEPKSVSQDISIQIPSQNAGIFTSKIVPVVPGAADGKAAPAPESPATTPPAVPAGIAKAVPAPVEASKAAAAPPAPVVDSEAAPAKAPVVEPKPKVKPHVAGDSEAAPAKSAGAEPKAKPKTKIATKTDARDGGAFVVQVAALNDSGKATQMREQIAAAGVKAYTEVVPTTKGEVTRVRAGPFASREAAEKARDRLKEMGLSGNVVPK